MSADEPAEAAAPPYTPIQATLLEMWEKVLWVRPIGLHDSFIDLGGHSLSAVRCINRIRLLFHVEVPLDAFFSEPADVATIAELIDRGRATAGDGA